MYLMYLKYISKNKIDGASTMCPVLHRHRDYEQKLKFSYFFRSLNSWNRYVRGVGTQ